MWQKKRPLRPSPRPDPTRPPCRAAAKGRQGARKELPVPPRSADPPRIRPRVRSPPAGGEPQKRKIGPVPAPPVLSAPVHEPVFAILEARTWAARRSRARFAVRRSLQKPKFFGPDRGGEPLLRNLLRAVLKTDQEMADRAAPACTGAAASVRKPPAAIAGPGPPPVRRDEPKEGALAA